MERTFVALKPDAVKRGLIGEIIARFEKKGYKIIALKMLNVTLEKAQKHYGEHVGKDFYENLISYITSGPIVALVVEGPDVISGARHIIGATRPNEADVGSIRGDFAVAKEYNTIHGADSKESAEREISIFFREDEFCENYKTALQCIMGN
ncbi:nucleoside-diphosphate kinase [Candidatus Gastranaerophilus sp. (ex Termes propinquus)]|nr:nucleoside-diphosphate kinase [Candidatus Gastranaerophilus sp. (ex Termes propinquus)]